MKATVFFDGACSGNPGPMGAGAIVLAGSKHEVISVAVGRGTNNEAEYWGLILGLEAAATMGATGVLVCGDSQLILRQLEGSYAVKAPNLQELHARAKQALQAFHQYTLQWVRRDANGEADAAARAALGR